MDICTLNMLLVQQHCANFIEYFHKNRLQKYELKQNKTKTINKSEEKHNSTM